MKGIAVRPGLSAVAVSLIFATGAAFSQQPVSGTSTVVIEEAIGEDLPEGMVLEEGPDGTIRLVRRDGATQGTAAGPVAKPQDPSKKPSPRIAKFSQVEFDRRPSHVLKTWGQPPKKPGETAAVGADGSPAGADGEAGAVGDGTLPPSAPGASGGTVAAGRTRIAGGAILISGSPATSGATASAAAPVSLLPPMRASTAASGAAPPTGASENPAAGPTAGSLAESSPTSRTAPTVPVEAAEDPRLSKLIDEEIAAWQRNVALGRWDEVAKYFAQLTPEESKAAYERMLQSLADGPRQTQPVPQQAQQFIERNRIAAEDFFALERLAPAPAEKTATANLGRLLRAALDQGAALDAVLARCRAATAVASRPAGLGIDRRLVARVLIQAGESVAAGEFLPEAAAAEAENDREGLNLLARHFLAQNAKELKPLWLERAWGVTQAALAAGAVDEDEKSDALRRAVELAPRIKAELGQAWLDDSFVARPERGMEILSTIGSSTALALTSAPTDADNRKKWLELQNVAAKALMRAAPARASEWSPILAVLAGNWLREAQVTYQFDEDASLQPRMNRDMFGNFFYGGGMMPQYRGNQPSSIKTAAMLDLRPDAAWLEFVEPAQRPRFDFVTAQLLLKAGEPDLAFPHIEALAAGHREPAKALADEFLQVWAKKNDPNNEQKRSNPYIFVYGFEERASGIPLTRSKQERNLAELGGWIARLRKLPLELDETLLTKCFTTAHGTAEVYRLETIESVFGPMAGLKPSVLASLAQGMRQNLATVWRDVAVQERAKTKRKKPEIDAEVLRGYELGRLTLERARTAHPASYELRLAEAAFRHDENAYRVSIKKDSGFAARRAEALVGMRDAARLYQDALAAGLPVEKESNQVYETWFYAALGACDLGSITHEHALAADEIPAIRAALDALGGERAARHVERFASSLFSRMGSAKPTVKFRYLREGLAITGDHKLAREAREVYDYYKDLVTEIKLVASIDGADTVGHGAPFGLKLALVHTRDIERESGGFGKYLQNQNAMAYSFNYGRPTEDYRDKFEEAARAALGERFDVVSVTYASAESKSRPGDRIGWRVTPYAYLLLKPKGPEVDRVPALRLDLDFLDTSGYAVIPVESAALPIDARDPRGPERPYSDLKLVQTLDERSAKDGKLMLEIKASTRGLPPPLAELVSLDLSGFETVKTDDAGPSVVKFDDEGDGTDMRCERTITLTLRPVAAKPASTFSFAKPKSADAAVERYRFEDADLVAAPETVDLAKPLRKSKTALYVAIFAALLSSGVAIMVAVSRKKRATSAVVADPYALPTNLTPFTVVGFLRAIGDRPGFDPAKRAELSADVAAIEAHYFGDEGPAKDLAAIARRWAAVRGA